jgi:hypothetical protein
MTFEILTYTTRGHRTFFDSGTDHREGSLAAVVEHCKKIRDEGFIKVDPETGQGVVYSKHAVRKVKFAPVLPQDDEE